jgi:tRNA pseudouridine38-40 synthase
MPRFALTLEFDGAGFSGTAPQPGRRTVLGCFRQAFTVLGGDPLTTRTSGRLDAGVHAAGLVVHLEHSRNWPPSSLARALAAHLPEDLVAWRAAAVPEDFDARFATVAKTYAYRVILRGVRPVLDRRCLHLPGLACPGRLAACAAALVGEHDLAAFACRRADGSDPDHGVRRIEAAGWEVQPLPGGSRWTFTVRGSGFLYRQIRGLVGAMLAVANDRAAVTDFISAIDAGWDHPRLGTFAPAQGLCLEAVHYDPEPAWEDA